MQANNYTIICLFLYISIIYSINTPIIRLLIAYKYNLYAVVYAT